MSILSGTTKHGAAIKVPEITLFFWAIKIMATTVGETAADLLSIRMNMGLTITSAIMAVVFLVCLRFQLRATQYRPSIYWLTVVLISVVGTLISDNLVDGAGIDLVTTSIAFSLCLLVTFVLWFRLEHTLSIHTIVSGRREYFYWAAILFTFAMGTSVGDLLAEQFDLGYALATVVFALAILMVAGGYYMLRLNAIACFWIAYILTRPLGASIGDWLAKPSLAGGLGFGTVTTSLIFLSLIFGIVLHLATSNVDRITSGSSD
jgi:uncharacterized membrane-anchored protein